MVNAPIVAKERNIDVREVINEDGGDYQTLIRLTLTTERGTRVVEGSLFGGANPRLVSVNSVPLEATLGKNMLYVNNEDKPGMIGAIGNLMSDAGINIANFHLGRNEDDAIALVELDSAPDEKLLAAVEKIDSVTKVNLLKF